LIDNLDRLMSQSLVAHTGTLAASTLRTHFNSPGATLPTTLSTVAVLVENSYGE
jgi:hypothetical protein